LLMVSPVRGDYRRRQAETPLILLFKFAGPALLCSGVVLDRSSLGKTHSIDCVTLTAKQI
ncbi:hypothetical protein, partial [Bradyrhizobium sp. LB12.1]|uniref:hypothetical protein n=1 Tax=Bradyrhizobium sp. LB12.1 TaxID=3156327 RepID=UPI003399AAD8